MPLHHPRLELQRTKIGEDLVKSIIEGRPYKSIDDFTARNKVNKAQVINLIKSGAFDLSSLGLWRYRPDLNWGMRVLQTLALPLGHGTIYKNRNASAFLFYFVGAGDEARTRYLHLGKVALYRMSYTRISVPDWEPWCLRSESNQRHADFQSAALPTELQRHVDQI